MGRSIPSLTLRIKLHPYKENNTQPSRHRKSKRDFSLRRPTTSQERSGKKSVGLLRSK
jgi:hypothetical protein